MNKTDRVLIVGGDSGIGKAVAAIYRQQGHSVVTTTRQKPQKQGELLINLEDSATWDCLGTNMWERVYFCIGTSEGEAQKIMEVNALRAIPFLDKLGYRIEAGGKLVLLTTHLSSPTFLNKSPNVTAMAAKNLSYVMSRAAFNAGAVVLSKLHTHCRWLLMHPGFVSTKATGYAKASYLIEPTVSAAGVVATAEATSMLGPLEFWDYRGYQLAF